MLSAMFGRAVRRGLIGLGFGLLVGVSPVVSAAPGDSTGFGAADSTDALPVYVIDAFTVEADRPLPVARTEVNPAMTTLPPVADGGDFLRLIPGVTGGRMGGHGIEPVIRGQQQTQLNILVDGSFIYGGCPNRMDPPSAISNFDTADRVTVLRGKQSVLHGFGGPGGTVLIEHLPPVFEAGATVRGRVSQSFESNGDGVPGWFDLAARRDGGYVRGTGRYRDQADYAAGDGSSVRSGFTQYGGGLALGWSESLSGREDVDFVEGSVEFDRTDDARFAGAGMDSPLSESWSTRVRGRRAVTGSVVKTLRGDVFFSNVDHEMDNFTLRPRESGFRRAITDSRTLGGRALVDLALDANLVTLGVDFQRQKKDADRLGNNTDPTHLVAVQSVLWPDLRLGQIGLFAEGRHLMSSRFQLVTGLRYDRIDFEFGRADQRPTLPTMEMLRSPNDLYRAFYGVAAEDVSENNLGGLARLEYEAPSAILVSLGVSRTLRTADPTERALASEMAGMSWVGNPALKPEQHHQIDLGATIKRSRWSGGLSLYVDRVDDYIFRDAARGQEDVLLTLPQADVYRNIDAVLAGAEFEAGWNPRGGWFGNLDLAYTHGENRDLDGPLAQIPPLQGGLSVGHRARTWELGARANAAARQARVDMDPLTGSGRDLQETPGYATLDLFGSVSFENGATLRAGVANLFDRAYANHLNRENGVDNEVLQVYEPGRSLYFRLMAEF